MSKVIIVGAGLAGLTCARRLRESGVDAIILEAGDAVGGRVRTDEVDGFLIDRGFQVLLTAYPESQRWLDYDALDLCTFHPGASVWVDGKWSRVADPRKRWSDLWTSLVATIGTIGDKLKVLKWALEANLGDPVDIFAGDEETSLERLRRRGFSEKMIECFWRPWLSGIFLEPNLKTSSRMLEFVFEMFARGETAVPRHGMKAIPEQLAGGLNPGQVKLRTEVARWEQGRIWDTNGTVYEAEQIVLAVDASSLAGLFKTNLEVSWNSAQALYFTAPKAPADSGLLMLNGSQQGVINHLSVLSGVNPTYAPKGQQLIMAGIRPGVELAVNELEREARAQLVGWFGHETADWRLLKHSMIKQALPARLSLTDFDPKPLAVGLWNCGDYTSTPSIQGAMESGRMVAEAILSGR